MKVLFVTHANRSHLYFQVPLAWALRSAGHEVRVAGQPEVVGDIIQAGLTAVSVGEPTYALDRMPEVQVTRPAAERRATGRQPMPRQTDYARDDPHAELCDVVRNGYMLFSPQSMVDDLVAEVRRWRPDLVIWDAITFAGPVAARAGGAAHARLIFGSDGVPQLRNGFREQRLSPEGAGLTDPFQEWLAPVLERYGCEFDEEMTVGQWTIDPMPPWHWRPSGVHYLLMRHVPYNGGAQVPEWLTEPPERRRVCITLGFTHREHFGSEASAADLLDAVADLDAEVVATLNAKQLQTLRTVPGNVRVVDFVPMNLLMPTCSAVVHHGGGGAFAAAVEHGVPQLIVPSSFANLKWWGPIAQANSLEEYGAGRYVADAEHLTPQALREDLVRVLDDPSFARNAAGLAAALRTAPAPSDIVPTLEELTAAHRGLTSTGRR